MMIVHRSPPRDENDEIHPHLGQGTGPINARSLPQHCKNSRVESAEKIYERPRGKSRGEPWSIENRIGGSFHRCRNRWRGFITPVANRNLRAMSFYRKEEARNVRGFCCPRPLPPSSPLFPSFLREREGGGEGRPSLYSTTTLFSRLASLHAVHGQKLAFCRDYFARVKPHSVLRYGEERGRVAEGYTHDGPVR